MKKLLLLTFILIAQISFGQIKFSFSGNNYFQGEIELEDGTVKRGFVLDIDDRSIISYDSSHINELFGSEEAQLNKTKNYYYFKVDKESEPEKISLKDIKRITIQYTEDEINEFAKTKILRPTNNLDFKGNEKEYLLPIYYSNAKLIVFSWINFQCQTNYLTPLMCGNVSYPFYIKTNDSEYAVKPINISFLDGFSAKKLNDRIEHGFKYLGKNCPQFIQNFDEYLEGYQIATKVTQKEMKAEYYAHRAELKAIKAEMKIKKKELNRKDYNAYLYDRTIEYLNKDLDDHYNLHYEPIIRMYINSCE